MVATVEEVRRAAFQLSPIKRIQLIQELLQGLQQDYPQAKEDVPPNVQYTPVTAMNDLAVDFWAANDLVEEPQNCFVPRRERERIMKDRVLGMKERAVGQS
jgi:hypothetical protein